MTSWLPSLMPLTFDHEIARLCKAFCIELLLVLGNLAAAHKLQARPSLMPLAPDWDVVSQRKNLPA